MQKFSLLYSRAFISCVYASDINRSVCISIIRRDFHSLLYIFQYQLGQTCRFTNTLAGDLNTTSTTPTRLKLIMHLAKNFSSEFCFKGGSKVSLILVQFAFCLPTDSKDYTIEKLTRIHFLAFLMTHHRAYQQLTVNVVLSSFENLYLKNEYIQYNKS